MCSHAPGIASSCIVPDARAMLHGWNQMGESLASMAITTGAWQGLGPCPYHTKNEESSEEEKDTKGGISE